VSTRNRAPLGGGILTSDGEVFQNGDRLRFQQRYNLAFQSIENGAVQATKRTAFTGATSLLYYGINVPEGRRLLEFTRTIQISGPGVFNVDLLSASDGFTGGVAALKLKLSECTACPSFTVTSDVFVGATPLGDITVLAESETIDIGTGQGQSTPSGASASEAVLKGFIGDKSIIRVQRISGTGAWTATLNAVYWEESL